jgi:quinol monooxygenase YgiN
MTANMNIAHSFILLPFAALIAGCAPGASGAEDAAAFDAGPQCRAELAEPDLRASPLQGPNGATLPALAPGTYAMSATYLTLRPGADAAREFQRLMAAISEDLRTRDGLVAFGVSTSSACLTARTLSVWRDAGTMTGFVRAPAHLAAIGAINRISRGGSNVTHWTGTERDATWTESVTRIGAAPGPTF